jgi:hypothetical protein
VFIRRSILTRGFSLLSFDQELRDGSSCVLRLDHFEGSFILSQLQVACQLVLKGNLHVVMSRVWHTMNIGSCSDSCTLNRFCLNQFPVSLGRIPPRLMLSSKVECQFNRHILQLGILSYPRQRHDRNDHDKVNCRDHIQISFLCKLAR